MNSQLRRSDDAWHHAGVPACGILSVLLSIAVPSPAGLGCDVAPTEAQPKRPSPTPAATALREPVERPRDPLPVCPAGMVLVGRFCIDRYEAHLVVDDPSVAIHPYFERPDPGLRYRARSAAGVMPQGYLSRPEAAEACTHAGKRLCKAREWQQACKGRAGLTYPYGTDEVSRRCNTGKLHLPAHLFGTGFKRYTPDHLNDPRLNREPGFLAKSGEFSGCVNDYGLFDMVGNLHEWVADDVNSALPKKIVIPYGAHRMGYRGYGVFMGGYFSSHREHGRGCEYVTTHHAPGYHDYSTGFRCCADPR